MNNPYEERLYEIKFYHFINNFFRTCNSPTRVYDFMELTADVTGVPYLYLRSATQRCILNEHAIRPGDHELIILYAKMNYGVRPTCRKLGVNSGSYYYTLQKYDQGLINVSPRFTQEERNAIMKSMKQLTQLLNILD